MEQAYGFLDHITNHIKLYQNPMKGGVGFYWKKGTFPPL